VKPEGKRPLAIARCRWEGNVNIGLKGMGWERVDWINLAQDVDKSQAIVKTVMTPWIP
jgi:hypothetical protein